MNVVYSYCTQTNYLSTKIIGEYQFVSYDEKLEDYLDSLGLPGKEKRKDAQKEYVVEACDPNDRLRATEGCFLMTDMGKFFPYL